MSLGRPTGTTRPGVTQKSENLIFQPYERPMTHNFRFGRISPEPLDWTALQQTAHEDPLALLERCQKRCRSIRKGTRRLQWELYVACYASALAVRRQPKLFTGLLAHEFCKGRKHSPKISSVLRLALLIGTDAGTSGPTYKKASSVANRLKPFFDQEIEPKDVLIALETAKGLPGATQAFSNPPRQTRVRLAIHRPHQKQDGELFGAPGKSTRQSRGPESTKKDASPPLVEGGLTLELAVDPLDFEKTLGSAIGSRFRVIIEHVRSGSDWKQMEATSFEALGPEKSDG